MSQIPAASAAQTQIDSVRTKGATGSVDSAGNVTLNQTGGKAPEMNKATVSKKLSKVMPSNYPLDTLLRNIGSGTTKSDKYEFYSIISRGIKATLGQAIEEGSGGKELTDILELEISEGVQCLSADADLLVPTYNVANGVATKVSGTAPARKPLILHIVKVDYAEKTIKVCGVNAPVPELVEDTIFYRMASAKDQDAAMSNDPMATPTKDYNYCQRNLCTISENAFQALQEKEVEYGMAEFKEQALLDFRYQAEISSIFGAMSEMIDPISQKQKLHAKGLLNFDIQDIAKTSGVTVEQFINTAMEKIFSNNNGSEKRLILYGPEFATELANNGVWTKQLDANATEVKWGITWKVIESNFGTVLGIMAPELGMVGYGKCALVIDPANIRRVDQVPLHERKLDLQAAGVRNSKDIVLEEAWTLEVTNPKTHALLSL